MKITGDFLCVDISYLMCGHLKEILIYLHEFDIQQYFSREYVGQRPTYPLRFNI